MHSVRSKRSNRGDTIVEVMIAIAIVSSVLAGAFTVSQKSTQAVRSSQERAEVLQILRGQIEQVRSLAIASRDTTTPIFAIGNFCISETTGLRIDFPAGATLDDHTSWTGCNTFGSSGIYGVAISYNQTTKTYKAIGKWNRIGSGINQAQLSYRIYPVPYTLRP